MFELVRSVSQNKRLLRNFVVRDLKGRYIGSSMGFFWSVLFPIINLLIYTFVFRMVLNARWSDQQPAQQVVLMMFAGIIVWQAFAEPISRSTNTLVENSNLIQKVVFPSEILPLYLVISSWVNQCIGLCFVLIGVAWLGYVDPLTPPTQVAAEGDPPYMQLALGAPLVVLPLLFLLQAIFTLGLGYLLAALNLFLRDTYHLIGVFLTVWMFSTPIFYSAVQVERAQGGKFAWILQVNPMYWLVDAYRGVLLFGQWPNFALLGKFLAVALVLFFLGSRFFLASKRRFPDLL